MERQPCENQDICPLRDSIKGCFEDVHHLYYPARDYAGGAAKLFRELEENKVRICRQQHNNEHALAEPPEKPHMRVMVLAIELAREKRLNGAA